MRLVPIKPPILISALGILISHLWSLPVRKRLATKLKEELGDSLRDAGTPQTAIIVLGFLRQSTKPHSPTEALSLRIQAAATEWRKRCRRHDECVIIASGGDPQRLGRTEAQDVKDQLVKLHKVDAERVVCETYARYTIENAYYSRRLVEKLGCKRVVVVTNEFHLKRTRIIFDDIFADFDLEYTTAPNGSALEAETGRNLQQWEDAEVLQLFKRGFNRGGVGTQIHERLREHRYIVFAARTDNVYGAQNWLNNRRGSSDDRERGFVLRGNNTALHYAALYGSLGVAQLLLDQGFSPNLRNCNGCTPLHFAMLVTDPERRKRMKQLLLSHGAHDNLLGRSAIWEGEQSPAALESDTQALMRTARLHGYRLEDRIALEPSTEYAELHEACALGDLQAVQKWINNNPGRTVDFTPIVASNSGRLYDHLGGTAADVTTSVDSDVHAASENTGLAYAASHGQLAVCNLLLKNGADPNHVNRNGATPLHYACFRQNREIVRLLLQYGGGKSVDVSGVSTLWDCKMTPLQLTQETGKVAHEIERALKQSSQPNREWVPVTAIQ